MEVKSRGVIKVSPASGSYQDYNVLTNKIVFDSGTVSTPDYSGTISTIAWDNTKRSGPIRTTRACDHSEVTVESKRIYEDFFLASSSMTLYRKATSMLTSKSLDSPLVLPNVSAYHAEALQFFKSGCQNQEIDLGANLFELKQVKTLLPSLKNSFKTLGSALRNQSIKRTLKSSADIHLSYSFGLKPLVSDVSSLLNCVKTIQDKITWLRKNSGKPVRVRFSKDLSTSSAPGYSIVVNNVNECVDIVTKHYSAIYTAFAVITYDVSKLSDLELQLKFFLKQMGLDKPLNTAWELLPWSFVVDWIFSVGQFLDRITPSMTLPTVFHDLGYSIKVECEQLYRVIRKYPRAGSGMNHATCFRKRYFRAPGLPISFSSIAETDISARQLALSFSLALQKWR